MFCRNFAEETVVNFFLLFFPQDARRINCKTNFFFSSFSSNLFFSLSYTAARARALVMRYVPKVIFSIKLRHTSKTSSYASFPFYIYLYACARIFIQYNNNILSAQQKRKVKFYIHQRFKIKQRVDNKFPNVQARHYIGKRRILYICLYSCRRCARNEEANEESFALTARASVCKYARRKVALRDQFHSTAHTHKHAREFPCDIYNFFIKLFKKKDFL